MTCFSVSLGCHFIQVFQHNVAAQLAVLSGANVEMVMMRVAKLWAETQNNQLGKKMPIELRGKADVSAGLKPLLSLLLSVKYRVSSHELQYVVRLDLCLLFYGPSLENICSFVSNCLLSGEKCNIKPRFHLSDVPSAATREPILQQL